MVVQGPVSLESVKSVLTCGAEGGFAAYCSLFLGNYLPNMAVALLCDRILLVDIDIEIGVGVGLWQQMGALIHGWEASQRVEIEAGRRR